MIRQFFGWWLRRWTREWGLDQVVVCAIIFGSAWWVFAC